MQLQWLSLLRPNIILSINITYQKSSIVSREIKQASPFLPRCLSDTNIRGQTWLLALRPQVMTFKGSPVIKLPAGTLWSTSDSDRFLCPCCNVMMKMKNPSCSPVGKLTTWKSQLSPGSMEKWAKNLKRPVLLSVTGYKEGWCSGCLKAQVRS